MKPIAASGAEPLYNPATESANEEQVYASTWELLRRNQAFQTIAKNWIHSKKFRATHALTPDYFHFARLVPRCALDWMLTPGQRLALAEFQIKKRTWQLQPTLNFGPVISSLRKSLAGMHRKDAYAAVNVTPLKGAPQPLTFSQAWNTAPEPFKVQFRFAVNPRKPGFKSINQILANASVHLGVIARKLAIGDPDHELQGMGSKLFELGTILHLLSGNHRLYAVAHGDYSTKAFEHFIETIKADFSGRYGTIFDGRKYDSHQSYLGTIEDWRWFLEAERQALDIKKSADLYRLAELTCEELRQRAMRGKAPARTKAHGHSGTPFTSKAIRNRRSAVKRHVLAIHNWIESAYLPLPIAPSAAIS